MKEMKVFLKTSSGLVPFEKANLPRDLKQFISKKLNALLGEDPSYQTQEHHVPTDMGFYIEQIAKRNNLQPGHVGDLLNAMLTIQPGAALSVLYRAIAMHIDLKYPHNHISEVENLYIISNMDGRIYPFKNNGRFNFRNFAAFRSMEDAKLARKIVGPLLREFYGGKQKNKGSKKG